jgi:hypothetical protein
MKATILALLERVPGLRLLWRQWRQRLGFATPPEPPPRQEPVADLPPPPRPPPRARLDPPDPEEVAQLADQLWGDGFLLPGGAAEANRLANLLPLSPATTLLLIGSDAGGAANAIATTRGAWVAAQQDNLLLAERMALKLRPLGKRATVATWDAEEPFFRHRYHHHALALEALRRCPGARLLPALSAALKPGGQLVLLELVAGEASGRNAALLGRWVELEGRAAPPEAAAALEAALVAAGFTLNVREDVGARHCAAVMAGWGRRVETLRQGNGLPRGAKALALVTEAERWLLRQRLMQAGSLRLLRWHCTRGPERGGGL